MLLPVALFGDLLHLPSDTDTPLPETQTLLVNRHVVNISAAPSQFFF
jgi:hypothetical protein